MKFLKSFDLKLFLILLFLYLINFLIYNKFLSHFLSSLKNEPVTDLILSNIPAIDMSELFVFGFFLPQVFLFFYLIWKKNFKVFFYFYLMIGMMTFIRLLFNPLTNLQVPSDRIFPKYFSEIFLDNDLFFSGHVGLPFILFLVYKKINNLKMAYLMLFWMVLMMVSVLFMKIHYSIDVFAAPFISFGIFVLVDEFLRKKENIKIEEEWRMLNICDI